MTTLTPGSNQPLHDSLDGDAVLLDTLQAQRRAFLAEGSPSLEVRRDRLDRLAASILGHAQDIAEAIRDDFGNRPIAASLAGDIATTVRDINDNRAHLKSWMRPNRPQPRYFRLAGINAWVEPQPLGVVGVLAPWNFPVALAVQPAAAALAAGNRVMVKMSELTPRTTDVVRSAIAQWFSPEELVVISGDAEAAATFSRLPFDHIFLTGSTAVGKAVQRAAAEHLVPVTLELGGKNPAVVSADADARAAARRIIGARLANSGQICHCPDYVFVPRAAQQEFIDACVTHVKAILPSMIANPDYCTIINERHFDRIIGLIDDARRNGARVIEVIPPGESLPDRAARVIPPTLVTNVGNEMALMNEEIFGPVLAVLPYTTVEDVIDFINARPTPLSAYWFGNDTQDYRRFRRYTRSGGVTRNDFALHSAIDGLPFGGVGSSGMGYYHGKFGFDTFSHLRAVAESPRHFSPTSLLTPPFPPAMNAAARGFLAWQHRRNRRRLGTGR